MSAFRRRLAAGLTATLAATLLTTVAVPEAALAAPGPSVELPDTPSTPVRQETVAGRGQDQATRNALSGNQKPTAAPKDGAGNPKATSLSPSATWQVSPQTGDFTWSYPLRVPPAPGGLEPELALSYASSAVDGRTSATNNQASWVGDGWDLNQGFIERVYGACAEDDMGGVKPPDDMGDLCWRSDNAVAAYGGGGGILVCCDGDGLWRPKADDGSRVQRLTGAGNGDDDGEYWKITTVDGTQYFFGSRPEAKSTWTVPVYGDDANEPCNKPAGLAASSCTQAWRWNLDKVVDRNGNMIVYGYDTETNKYGKNRADAGVDYIRGGALRTVEYGMRAGGAASGRVEFDVASRCVPGSDCTPDKKDNWPDVPWDSKCDSATCKDQHSPSFWSTRRLSKVTTFVRNGSGGFDPVDAWALDQQFPATGDGEKASLWLKSIRHSGLVKGAIDLPLVTFEGTMMANRVFKVDGVAPLTRYRVTGVVSETGGAISVTYKDPDCVEGSSMPANPETNTLRCYPVRWSLKNQNERTDYFHKYVVESVVLSDRFNSPFVANREQVTRYEYLDGAAWHYDTSEFTKDDKRTWDEFRGFAKVRIRTGVPNDPSGPVGMTEQRFYRGMNGDKLPHGTRSELVRPSHGPPRPDEDWLAGSTLETITYDGDSDAVVGTTIETPTWGDPTAVRAPHKAYMVRAGATETWTTLAAGGARTTRTEYTYDDRGLVTNVSDLGDTGTPDDDRCTGTTYARNLDAWLMSFPSRVETVAVRCGATPTFPDDAIGDVLTGYDGKAPGVAPAAGNVTVSRALSARPKVGDPEYYTVGGNAYDAHGRVTAATDARGFVTTTAYTPATGGPLTQTVVTNPLGHAVTTTFEPAWGLPSLVVDANRRKTENAYDPLGRLVEVWLPNRDRATYSDGNAKFAYAIRGDAPSVVTSRRINPNGDYVTTKELFDGLLRPRQTQEPAEGGGRLLTDTRYDSQGRAYKTTQPYFNDGAVDDQIWVASDTEIPGHTLTLFDGAGRPTAEVYKAGTQEAWRTTTTYGGDRVNVEPPLGGTATTAVSDARGQLVELRQYHGGTPSGAFDATTYTYTGAGKLASTKDPAGNVWRFGYDLRGNQILSDDADRGRSVMTHDDAGNILTVKDARGVTLATTYDKLGRKETLKSGGTTLASWTYDTATRGKGKLATSTRYVDGAAYTRAIGNYTELYHPSKSTVTIPETPLTQTLAGSYTTYSTLNWDGSPDGVTLPEIGDLRKETVDAEYDLLGNQTKVSGGPEGSPTFEYVSGTDFTRYGELARLQLGAVGKRAWLSFYYETNSRRLSRSIVDAEVPRPMQTDVNYTYDPAGNITSVANTPAELTHDVQCFRYDHLRRLTDAWTPARECGTPPSTAGLAGAAPYWHSYTYDTAGNRLTETQHAAGGDTLREYGYPAPGAHKLTSVTTRTPVPKKEEFTYDAAGNTLTRPGQALDWDAEGLLTKVTGGGEDTRFVYDADGQRLIRDDPTSVTLYLDGQDLKLTKATGKLTATRYYQRGDSTVATRTAAGVTWEFSDHQDTANVAVEAATQKVTQRRQTPFGAPRGAPVPWAGDRGFVGGTMDGTGLTSIGARQYDPLVGRFISVDPIMDLTDAQQMHGYTYGNNNPVTLSDPSGMGFFDWLNRTAKSAWNVVKTVAKHAAPVLGWASLALMATPIGAVIGTAAFVVGAINVVANCMDPGGNAADCVNDVAGAIPGVGKMAVGAARLARNSANLLTYAHGTANVTYKYGAKMMGALEDGAKALGRSPHQWLNKPLLGMTGEVAGAVTLATGTVYYGVCDLAKLHPCPGVPNPDTVAAAQQRAEAAKPYQVWRGIPYAPDATVTVYPWTFTGPVEAGAFRGPPNPKVKNPFAKHSTPVPPSPPGRKSVPGPNNTYTTGDGRTCNRGGGMCAI